MEALIHFHAGRVVVMENAADHSSMIYAHAVALCCIPRCDGFFYIIK
jgi:hypothetical protein